MSLTEKDSKYEEKMKRLTRLERDWLHCFLDKGIEDDREICQKIPKYKNRYEDEEFDKAWQNTRQLRRKVTNKLLEEKKKKQNT